MLWKDDINLADQAFEKKETKEIKLPGDLTERQFDIIRALADQKDNPLKLSELQKLLVVRYPERTLRRELNTLKDKGLIDRKGQTNRAAWFIKE